MRLAEHNFAAGGEVIIFWIQSKSRHDKPSQIPNHTTPWESISLVLRRRRVIILDPRKRLPAITNR